MAARSRSKTIPLLVLLISILCLYFPVKTTAAVDMLYVTLKWPGTLYESGQCCMPTTGPPAEDFLIDDIKTYDSVTGQFVKNCNPSCRFSINLMQDLITDLYSYWSDLNCPCNNGLQNWKNTWCTYGNCSKLSQHDYFQAALNMSTRANLVEVFKVNGIEPSTSTSYKLRDIQTALMANLGLSTQVECVKSGFLLWERTLLSKINICVSANGKYPINCPFDQEKVTCNDDVWIYPFSSNKLKPCRWAAGSGDHIDMVTEKNLAM
ncbi:Ribonuclease T(2) protein [Dioscorea alata]|uniref:Ribonuclease T(2) protein n=1 Tax=Dioscorea alata TaxID=55571 RepID=A0ACB7W0G6_DIOAL|nr:Ribonuclease T(2) protein [Dioscorea alata]